MTPIDPTPIDPNETLTDPGLGAAVSAHADRIPTGSLARRGQRQRHATPGAVNRSSHPLEGVAYSVPYQSKNLVDDNRTAGLLLFAQLARNPESQQETGRGIRR